MGLLDKFLGKKDAPAPSMSAPATATMAPSAPAPAAPRPAPAPVRSEGAKEAHDRIDNLITTNKVVLFMKGSKLFPQCGFSAATVEILNQYGVPFVDVDVLSDPGIRQGVKEFSQWPTIPQLFIDGKFVGGCDIAREMHANGELAAMLKGGEAAQS